MDTHPKDLLPLCVDLDGTLIKTDVTYEAILAFIRRFPWKFLMILVWVFRGRAYLKQKLSAATSLRADLLPYHQGFLDYLHHQQAQGRPLYLVTAADQSHAHQVAAYLGIFTEVIASDGQLNQRSTQKAQTLVDRFGREGFVYAGNSRDDVAVWSAAKAAIVVQAPKAVLRRVQALGKTYEEFPAAPFLPAFLTLIRPHQWAKNTLLFWPLIASHTFLNLNLTLSTLGGFLCFSLVASGIYIFNDLMDIESDRQHPRKKDRPLAQGAFPIPLALGALTGLLATGCGLSFFITPSFPLIVLVYLVLTLFYSLRLKQVVLLDVLVLSFLYTLRVIGGYEATGLEYSNWLLSFSGCVFLSLAFMKRFTELRALIDHPSLGAEASLPSKASPLDSNAFPETLPGRGYKAGDRDQIARFGTTMGYLSVLVLALYIDSQAVKELYRKPYLLWGVCPGMVYLISYLWLVAERGAMHDDPVVFALKSKKTYGVIAYLLGVGVLALLA